MHGRTEGWGMQERAEIAAAGIHVSNRMHRHQCLREKGHRKVCGTTCNKRLHCMHKQGKNGYGAGLFKWRWKKECCQHIKLKVEPL